MLCCLVICMLLTMFALCSDVLLLIKFSYADILLDDFLVAENSSFQSEINSHVLTSERSAPITNPKMNHNLSFTTTTLDGEPETPSSGGVRYFSFAFFLQFFDI